MRASRPRLEKAQERRRGHQRGRLVCNCKQLQTLHIIVRVLYTASQREKSSTTLTHSRTHTQDTAGDKMSKGGAKLVAYPESNLANNRLRQSYGKSTSLSTNDSSGSPAPSSIGAMRGEAGAGGGGEATPAASRGRAVGTRSARKSGGRKGSSRAAEAGNIKFRDLGGVEKLLQVSCTLSLPPRRPPTPPSRGVEHALDTSGTLFIQ